MNPSQLTAAINGAVIHLAWLNADRYTSALRLVAQVPIDLEELTGRTSGGDVETRDRRQIGGHSDPTGNAVASSADRQAALADRAEIVCDTARWLRATVAGITMPAAPGNLTSAQRDLEWVLSVAGTTWDLVYDVSGFVMVAGGSDIAALVELLDGSVGHYVFVSSIMAYDQSLVGLMPWTEDMAVETSGLFAPEWTPPPPEPWLPALRLAIRAGHAVRVCYRDGEGRDSERTLWPFAMAFLDDRRLLAAWCELRGDFRHFRADRMQWLVDTGQRYPAQRHALIKRWRAQLKPAPAAG